jgi:hypothetical protein
MASVSNQSGLKSRASQDETAPFPLEFMLAAALASQRSQDETAPFPLEFEVVARRTAQDETAPFPLEFMVTSPDGEAAIVRVPRVSAGEALPALKWRGLEASRELREYAARIASGEDLPPYRGPLLAEGAAPWAAPERQALERPQPERTTAGATLLKLALGLMLLMAALVASAVLGDDAQLRATGESIQRWFTGASGSFQDFPVSAPPPANAAPAAR